MMLKPFWLDADRPGAEFPHPDLALDEPNGLLAAGGDLSPARLRAAYRQGIFPWYSEGEPILWWSPNPRAVLFPEAVRVSRSLAKTLRRGRFSLTFDRDFAGVIDGCAAPRAGQAGTWISAAMRQAYRALHRQGLAHSIECWDESGALAGGLYGLAIGRVFFGESMFSRRTDASKVALVTLAQMGFELIDCQVENPHLARLGAVGIERDNFLALLDRWCEVPAAGPFGVPQRASA